LLEELVAVLATEESSSVHGHITHGSSPTHGLQRLENGFEIKEVVEEYNILRNCIHDLAENHGVAMEGRPVHILNRALDAAIGAAIEAYVVQQALNTQQRREDYLAFIAHDLRTPLTAVALTAHIIEKELAPNCNNDRTTRALSTLQRNIGYLTAQVNKVLQENINLETESGFKLELRQLDLWPLVESLIHDLHPVAGAGTTRLINDIPEDLVVCADAALLRRIFQNLIANAIRHTPNGKVRIAATRVDREKTIRCEVTDNGAGIAADRMSRVFDKFETDGKRATDIGLGLTICKTFVEALGGTISVESRLGSGTSFYFTLPDRS
jgi:signal transduction histidine kinase